MAKLEKPTFLTAQSVTRDDKRTLTPRLRFPAFQGGPGWSIDNLSAVAEFINERVPVGEIAIEDYISTENILPDFGGATTASKLPPTGSATRFRADDILVSNIRPYLKKVWSSDRDGGASNDVIVIRAKSSISKCFLPFVLRNESFIDYVMTGAKGVKMPRGDIGLIKGYPVSHPSHPEQQKIADCLTSLDELIAGQGRKVEALKVHKKGLMQQLFPREGETLPRLRFPEFRKGPNWTTHAFEEFVAKSFYGTSQSTSLQGQYPVLRMGNMFDGALDFSNLVYLDLGRDDFESIRLQDGDILLNRTNSRDLVGKISIFDRELECITASYIVTFRLEKDRLLPVFCNAMLNTQMYKARIKMLARPSVSQANINPTTFRKELRVCVPTVAEQQRIADCVSTLDARIAAETDKLAALKAHKQGLMQQLFPSPEER